MSLLTNSTVNDISELTGDYNLDPSHSRIGFQARHAMVTKVRGAFNDFEGSLRIDAQDPTKSSAKVTIQAASIDTRNADRDAHLKGNDFFAMDEYPEITFVSTAAEKVDDANYRLTGDLTIKGVTKPVTVDFEFTGAANDPWGNLRIGFEGAVTINRKDWGVSWNTALETGGILVSEKVTLEFDLAAVKVV
jgi:polyisoprenoid-binding protein YceI